MKTKFISKESDVAKFDIIFSDDEFENAVVEAYKKNKDKFNIDGFRKGKAPRKIIEQRYGADIFYEEALNDMLVKFYPEAINAENLEVIEQPNVSVKEVKKGQDIVINVSVRCFPEVDVDGYKGIEIENKKSTVTEDQVDEEIERVRNGQARLETITDRKTKDGDTIVMDFEGSIDGVKFEGGSAENFELKLGSGQFIPGFEEQLIDKEAGSEVDVNVTFPEDYQAKDLAGKPALFKTKIHEIKETILPSVDDEFASDVSEFETLAEYRNSIKEKLQNSLDIRNKEMMKNDMLKKFADANDIDVPKQMVDDEIERMMKDLEQKLAYQGMRLDDYIKYIGKETQAFKEDMREDAEASVKMSILLKAVIKKENINATEEELENELKQFADNYGKTIEQVKEMLGEGNLRFFEDDIKIRNAVNMMFDNATLK